VIIDVTHLIFIHLFFINFFNYQVFMLKALIALNIKDVMIFNKAIMSGSIHSIRVNRVKLEIILLLLRGALVDDSSL
jgi:hypothetical protein